MSIVKLVVGPAVGAQFLVAVAVLFVMGVSPVQGKQWALLISVSDHRVEELNKIKYTLNDAEVLRDILIKRGGVPSENICQVNQSGDRLHKPTMKGIVQNFLEFLTNPAIGVDDRLILYYSGHGAIVGGRTYLIPSDFDPKDPAGTLIPIDELHKALKLCKAKTKLLVFDCCHAGNNNQPAMQLPAGKELRAADGDSLTEAVDVDDLPGCCVLASCRKRESSYEWPARKHGVFTYWLCRALEGGADIDSDGSVSFDEAATYTHRQVTRTMRTLNGKRQTPVRQIGFDVVGDPTVLSLLPEPPESLCRRLAEHMDLEIRAQGIEQVGFLNFVTPINNEDVLARANLPSYLADRIREELRSLSAGEYQTVERRDVEAAANSKEVTVEQIGQGEGLDLISKQIPGLGAVVWGRLDRRKQNVIVQCELLHVTDGRLASSTGVLPLSEDLLADYGVSFSNLDRPSGSPYAPAVLAHVESESQSNPLQQPEFPFRVELWKVHAGVGEKVTPKTKRTRLEYYSQPSETGAMQDVTVAVNEGDLFEVRLWNRLEHPVAMVVMVDGFNSLGYKRERTGRAKPWVVPPTGDQCRVIEGWTETGTINADSSPGDRSSVSADIRRFRFTSVDESVAGANRFTDSLGLISVAVYAERGRAVGVGLGQEEHRVLQTVDFQPGRLLASINVRYVDASVVETE